jgi:hypothetical protein
MAPRRFALIAGIFMLVTGIFAFVPTLSTHPLTLPFLRLEASYGYFLDIFPMNIMNKIALILFGIAGIAVSNSLSASISYSKVIFIVMGLLAISGFFPGLNTMFGYWPLYGAEILMHAIFSALGGYFGYAYVQQRRVAHG